MQRRRARLKRATIADSIEIGVDIHQIPFVQSLVVIAR
jgi:hypothetical protein